MSKTPWQLRREREERTERNIRLAICGLIILAVLILQSIATKPLPSNLGALVVSPGALARLQGVQP